MQNKKDFKVLLLAPNFIEKWNKLELACKENLSINALAAYLIAKGYDVTVINAQFENWDNAQVLAAVNEIEFDFIGVSCSPQKLYLASRDFIKKARKRYPDACIAIGGVFPSMSYKEILMDLPEVDYVSTGEGEIALEQLCGFIQNRVESIKEIPGLAYRAGDQIKLNPSERIRDLDILPFPLRDPRTFENVKGDFANVMAGRGCYGNCSFCSIHSAYDFHQRICRSASKVVDEIEMLVKKYKVEYIQFHDDIFYDYSVKSQEWLAEFIEEIKKRAIKFKFRIYLRPNDVRIHELLTLKEIGLDTVFIGIESGVQRVLNEMRKGITVKQAEAAIATLKEANINISMGFITIVPTMTFEELKENFEFLYKIRSDNDANYHNRLNIYNGCYYEYILRNQGLLCEKENFWDIHSYRFLDPRVKVFHDYLQFIKEWGKTFRHKANDMIARHGKKCSDDVNNIVAETWMKVTKELLYFVETSIDNDIRPENIESFKVYFAEGMQRLSSKECCLS